jgi:hypothetical protein
MFKVSVLINSRRASCRVRDDSSSRAAVNRSRDVEWHFHQENATFHLTTKGTSTRELLWRRARSTRGEQSSPRRAKQKNKNSGSEAKISVIYCTFWTKK